MTEIEQIRAELEQQRKMCLYFSEQADHWWKQYHHARRRLTSARILLRNLKQAVQSIQEGHR